MNLRRWFQDHSLKLLAIRDTPEAIAGGVAIGIFFWFPPLLGLKTVGAIFFAWLTRSNILAAVIAVTLHDVLLPVMIVVYRWEYCLGFWILSSPHHWPQRLSHENWILHRRWTDWGGFFKTFAVIGKPMLLGSLLLGVPTAVVSFFITRNFVEHHRRKKLARTAPPSGPI